MALDVDHLGHLIVIIDKFYEYSLDLIIEHDYGDKELERPNFTLLFEIGELRGRLLASEDCTAADLQRIGEWAELLAAVELAAEEEEDLEEEARRLLQILHTDGRMRIGHWIFRRENHRSVVTYTPTGDEVVYDGVLTEEKALLEFIKWLCDRRS